MAGEFWLSEAQWGAIEPLLAKNQPGARRTDDRRVISGIVPVLKTGCRGPDCPSVDAPPTTIDNRFRRWTMRGLWRRRLEALARAQPGDGQAIDSTTAKAHRSAAGGKGGPRRRRLVARAAAARPKSTSSPMRADGERVPTTPAAAIEAKSVSMRPISVPVPRGRVMACGLAVGARANKNPLIGSSNLLCLLRATPSPAPPIRRQCRAGTPARRRRTRPLESRSPTRRTGRDSSASL